MSPTIQIDRQALAKQAHTLWDQQPILELAYGDFQSFLEARTLEAFERNAEFSLLSHSTDERHAQQCADATARLASIRRPLSRTEEPHRSIDVFGGRITAWLYGRFADEDGDGCFSGAALSAAIGANPDADTLLFRIASCGGFIPVLDRMTATIRSFAGRTVAVIDTAASSSAARFALTCSHVVMRAGATLMFHRTHRAAHGNCRELTAVAQALEAIDARLDADLLASRPSVDPSRLQDAIDTERYLTADEALEMGLIDEITRPLRVLTKETARA
jgi:ATP-dependent protease ClpP protease subunit